MPPLATLNANSLDIQYFDMQKMFFSNTKISEVLVVDREISNILERVIALVALILISPLLFVVAMSIKILMPGPVIYSQIRVGRDGRDFEIFKFRSMVVNAESESGPTLATENDNGSTRMDHVSIGATAKRQPKQPFPFHQIGERIVFSIIEDSANICDSHLRRFSHRAIGNNRDQSGHRYQE